MYCKRVEICDLPKRINQTRGVHWSALKKETDLWHFYVHCSFRDDIPPKPLKKAKLTLTRFSSVCPDYDGLVISFKRVIDALVKIKVLEDDAMPNIGMPTFVWEKAPKKMGKIRINIEEVE